MLKFEGPSIDSSSWHLRHIFCKFSYFCAFSSLTILQKLYATSMNLIAPAYFACSIYRHQVIFYNFNDRLSLHCRLHILQFVIIRQFKCRTRAGRYVFPSKEWSSLGFLYGLLRCQFFWIWVPVNTFFSFLIYFRYALNHPAALRNIGRFVSLVNIFECYRTAFPAPSWIFFSRNSCEGWLLQQRINAAFCTCRSYRPKYEFDYYYWGLLVRSLHYINCITPQEFFFKQLMVHTLYSLRVASSLSEKARAHHKTMTRVLILQVCSEELYCRSKRQKRTHLALSYDPKIAWRGFTFTFASTRGQ